MHWISRRVATEIDLQLRTFPAVLLLGPRQAGKTTLARNARPEWSYFDLEDPADFEALRAGPRAFFETNPRHVIIDEAQRGPELFPALRSWIDRDRRTGSFILLGSASPRLMREVSESLTGRLGIVELTPFRADELAGLPAASERWFWGGFPPVLELTGNAERIRWLEGYVRTFLESDLRSLGWDLPAQSLRTMWAMLAYVHGGALNASDLARALDVSVPTVMRYLDALEGAFMIRRLRPHMANVTRRLVKTPRVYIRDSGLLHRLAGLNEPDDLLRWPRRGQSFEGLVIEELIARAHDTIPRPYAAFWRTAGGHEIDLLIGTESKLFPIEIKAGSRIDARDLAGMRTSMKDLNLDRGWVITAAGDRRDLGGGIEALPWSMISTGEVPLPL